LPQGHASPQPQRAGRAVFASWHPHPQPGAGQGSQLQPLVLFVISVLLVIRRRHAGLHLDNAPAVSALHRKAQSRIACTDIDRLRPHSLRMG
jgi:hypothetical protein